MELFLLVIEGVFWITDVLAVGADVYSWIKGTENRIERKEARRTGSDVPPRDSWNRRVIIFSILVGALTAAMLVWKLWDPS